MALLRTGDLDPQIGWRGPWDKAIEAAETLLARRVPGKALLDLPPRQQLRRKEAGNTTLDGHGLLDQLPWYWPEHPLSPRGRRIFQIGIDTWLVEVRGATQDFHFRVSAARLMDVHDKNGESLLEA